MGPGYPPHWFRSAWKPRFEPREPFAESSTPTPPAGSVGTPTTLREWALAGVVLPTMVLISKGCRDRDPIEDRPTPVVAPVP
jgi:hypothetical protein